VGPASALLLLPLKLGSGGDVLPFGVYRLVTCVLLVVGAPTSIFHRFRKALHIFNGSLPLLPLNFRVES
jgi:hypothetical protein